jgi:exosome complex component MTR3
MELTWIVLRTGVTPSASGSAYLELESQFSNAASILSSLANPSLKLICTVHGPRPLPRSAPFAPDIVLAANVKFAPFATRQRRGYVRDTRERVLALQLETALRGVIIGDRWPKSGLEVTVTILEGEDWWSDGHGITRDTGPLGVGQWGMMSVLSGCITVASAAIADAGIDCVDIVAGGFAALVRNRNNLGEGKEAPNLLTLALNPTPSEHHEVLAACTVGYLPSKDEITVLWVRGELDDSMEDCAFKRMYTDEDLTNIAVQAAIGSHGVLAAAIKEAVEVRLR